MNLIYKNKYLKYKQKYIELQNLINSNIQLGGKKKTKN